LDDELSRVVRGQPTGPIVVADGGVVDFSIRHEG